MSATTTTAVEVHPLVLLNIVDHVTRHDLSHRSAPAPPPGSFLSTAGLLMGTISPANAGVCTAVLFSSFELPFRLNAQGEAIAPVPALNGDGEYDMVHLLERAVDWAAALQHREQLAAVMPEAEVVGCYVVCTGARENVQQHSSAAAAVAKKPRNESPADAESPLPTSASSSSRHSVEEVAQSVATSLVKARLLPAPATTTNTTTDDRGCVLLVVYDGEVAQQQQQQQQQGIQQHRLPFDAWWVAEKREQQRHFPTTAAAAPAPVKVTPAEMEWIGLALPSPSAVETAGTAPPAKPSFLRRCSAALLSAATATTTTAAPKESSGTSSPTATSPRSAGGAGAAASMGGPLSQSRRSAESLLTCLNVLTRVVDAAPNTPIDATALNKSGTSAELLRSAATCIRNVPNAGTTPSQPHDAATSPSPPSASSSAAAGAAAAEDLLRALLAMEARCAMRLSTLQLKQRSLVVSRKVAMNAALNRRGTAVAPPQPQQHVAGGGGGERALSHVSASANTKRAAAAHPQAGTGGGGPYVSYRGDGRARGAMNTVIYGHVWQ